MPRVFKIQRCIGRGGFGEVYHARVHEPGAEGRCVALKILHADLDPNSKAVERLRDESRMLRTLDHPHILSAEDLAVIDGRVALVTEFVRGADLGELAKTQPLPIGPALELIAAVADALHEAQVRVVGGKPLELVHRDVKPANIRVGTEGDVRLLDFGVARTERLDREASTETDVVMGSLPYLAPEVITQAASTHASDVYALGVTLFFALRGERILPQKGPDLFGLLLHEERFTAEVEARLEPLEDRAVAGWIRRMVDVEPDNRPSHLEVRDALRELAAAHPPSLAEWCAAYRWPDARSLPGVLSGRVFEEQAVDPSSIGATPARAYKVDPDAQAVTRHDPSIRQRVSTPIELTSSDNRLPVENGSPTPAQLIAAVAGIGVVMVVGFVSALTAGLYLLP